MEKHDVIEISSDDDEEEEEAARTSRTAQKRPGGPTKHQQQKKQKQQKRGSPAAAATQQALIHSFLTKTLTTKVSTTPAKPIPRPRLHDGPSSPPPSRSSSADGPTLAPPASSAVSPSLPSSSSPDVSWLLEQESVGEGETEAMAIGEEEQADDTLASDPAPSQEVLSMGTTEPWPQQQHTRVPSYYLHNFLLVLDSVRKLHGHLLRPDEEDILRAWEGQGEAAKRLYIRLFQRRGPWFRTSTLSYPEIDLPSAIHELNQKGFCEVLETIHDADITTELLCTLSKYQLQAIMRSAQSASPSPLGKRGGSNMRVAEIIATLASIAQSGIMQRTLDGRSVLSKLVERELRVASASNVDPAAPFYSTSSSNPELDFAAIRLTRPAYTLFKRVHRLFFMNDSQDMTLLVLVGMEKIKYPTYHCPHADIYAWKRAPSTASQETEDEETEETSSAEKYRLTVESDLQAQVKDVNGKPGDESFLTPPPSPFCKPQARAVEDKTCECYWWRSPGREGQVFPSRLVYDQYERALALADELGALTSVGPKPSGDGDPLTGGVSTSTSPSFLNESPKDPEQKSEAKQEDKRQHIEGLLSTIASFLLEAASLPQLDPYSEVIRIDEKQKKKSAERSRQKRYSSNAAFVNARFPSIADEVASALPLSNSTTSLSRPYSSSESSSSSPPLSSQPPPASIFTTSLVLAAPPSPVPPMENTPRSGKEKGHPQFSTLIDHCPGDCAASEVWRAWVTERPFLSRFTHGWVLARALHDAVPWLEKQKRYNQAAACLRLLLSTPFCTGKRGHWWNRLSLNVEHQDRKKHALILAETALQSDQTLRLCDQLTLQKRVLKLAKPPLRWSRPSFLSSSSSSSSSSSFSLPIFSIASLKQPRSTIIRGRLIRDNAKSGKKSAFLGYDGRKCTVEQFALQYYAQEGRGWQGMHSENGVFKTLFGILMWDVLFANVPGVFVTPFQVAPLDLVTDAFYVSRRSMIERRLDEIRTRPLPDLLAEAWTNHGTQCLGVDWHRYKLRELQVIASCVGGHGLANMFRLLAEDYKGWGHGLPDLLLWKETEGVAKLVEVKGPRDRLSSYQQVWLDQLLASGLDCEVCYVREMRESSSSSSLSSLSPSDEPPGPVRKRKLELPLDECSETQESGASLDNGWSTLKQEEDDDDDDEVDV